ncbi:RNA-directed DNA polymerase, eukaryota, reverse transcriptase zinc-binding domain protein, partial [Tanacetum coccineum]
MLNKKCRKAAINGVLEDGTWISDLRQVKDRFCTFFHEKIKHFNGNRMVTPSARMMKLSDEQVNAISCRFSLEEIKKAVWSCGCDRAPGPDGFTFRFIKQFWDMIKEDIQNFVHEFYEYGVIPVRCNSSFITLIPKVSSPVSFKDYRPISLIGIQYKIVAKLLANRMVKVIDDLVHPLQSAFVTGDPLSPFLFILAMEGLHVAMEDAVEHGIFHDIRVGPGLRINLHKSKLYGVGVSLDEAKEFSSNTGCSAASLPFTYIGLPVGCNIRRISSWEDMISKVQKKLSTYRKIAWVQWSQVLNSKENGNLGIRSLKALNLALIQKWRWRFHTDKRGIWNKIISSIYGQQGGFGSIGSHMHGSGVWSSILKAIHHMHDRNLVKYSSMWKKTNGRDTRFWSDLWVGDQTLKERFPRVFALERIKDCSIADRWHDDNWNWIRNMHTRGRTGQQFLDLLYVLQGIDWSENEDVWRWELGHERMFSVTCTRIHIDNLLLYSGELPTRWNTLVPIKVNILGWRIRMDRLPTLEKLDQKGIYLSSLLCPVCNTYIEDVNHVFVTCDLASQIWDRIFRWLDMAQSVFLSIADIMDWIISIRCSLKRKKVLEAIILTSMWVIWKYRNNTFFGLVKMKRSSIFDVIVSNAFEWCS